MTSWTFLIWLMTWLLLTSPIAAAGLATGPAAESDALPAMLQLTVARSRAGDVGPEYHIGADGRGTNPRHGLALTFTSRGAHVEGPDGGLGLRLERFGRGDGEPVRHAAPRVAGAWVEYDRGSGLSEWFANLPRGVEQGWTVTERPAGRGPLVLDLDTGLPPDRGDAGRLAWSGLVYHRLVALDARGRRLPSRWVHDGSRLHIEVEDHAATYPVLIDPWVEQAKLIAADGGLGHNFGIAVALSNDTALVGAQYADSWIGAAYVFVRSDGFWTEQAKLTPSDGVEWDTFSYQGSVTLSDDGDTALIGAPGSPPFGVDFPGKAYVFTRSEGIWTEQAKLTASDGAAGDHLGMGVAISGDGDTAVVGASGVDIDGKPDQGAVYVFVRSDGVWAEQAKLTASDGTSGDGFGRVALSGDTAMVGAPGAKGFQGRAYVYVHQEGAWTEQATLIASDGAPGDNFGYRVALADENALVGAWGADVSGRPDQGAAYAFTRNGENWSEQAKLTASDGAADDAFSGGGLALSPTTAVVGAAFAANTGTAYVFTRSGEIWSEQAKLTASDEEKQINFGEAVSISGNTTLVGAPGVGEGPDAGRGAAYVFILDDNTGGPTIIVDPTSLSFMVSEGGSDTDDLAISNTGSGSLNWSIETAEPAACDTPTTIPWLSVAPDFGSTEEDETDVVSAMIDAGALAPGDHEALLCVASNDPEQPVTEVPIALTVTPVPAPELIFDPTNLDFGDVEVGSTGLMTATLLNTGDAAANGLTATVDPPGSGFAADINACGDSLPTDGSCEVGVTFTPAEPGPAEAALHVGSNEGASAGLALTGNGELESGVFVPMALAVDTEELFSDGNDIFEPDELVDVAPAWRNDGSFAQSLTGTAADFLGPEGASHDLAMGNADYGSVEPGATASCLGTTICYRLGVDDPAARPATHWEATFEETLDNTEATSKTWSLHIGGSFSDVPRESPFYRSIETLLHGGVASGCTGSEYCPQGVNTRSQMAVFLLRAVEGADYLPPACAEGDERFDDVPAGGTFCSWIEELAERGITAGCGGGNYCPTDSVTRGQMAIFLLRAAEGDGYAPPPCTGEFSDVSCPSAFAAWIEELAARGITSGCSPGNYCPGDSVTRAQMAVFVTRAFGLVLYGP